GLPDKYRAAIVLCDLEGRPLREAAQLLNCPVGTVGTGLARGRRLVAGRLGGRCCAWPAGAMAALLPREGLKAMLLNNWKIAVALLGVSLVTGLGVVRQGRSDPPRPTLARAIRDEKPT